MEGVRRRLTLSALMLFSALTAATVVAEADYVGNAACAGCHEQASADWANSHHDLAMQKATPGTVLGGGVRGGCGQSEQPSGDREGDL